MSPKLTPTEAVAIVTSDTPKAVERLNAFTYTAFRTRGGRLGSGMGTLLEALWVYFINEALLNEGGEARMCEIAWMKNNEPDDFACVHRDAEWTPSISQGEPSQGELFRIEAKSMNIDGVKEPKAHFTRLTERIGDYDQLLVFAWQWERLDAWRFYPEVKSFIICPSKPVALLRDALHRGRGGSFVEAGKCPDRCPASQCTHIGEPLNSNKARERKDGPDAAKLGKANAADNFGSLVRMLRTQKKDGVDKFREIRKHDQDSHESAVQNDFISFIHNNLPNEEENQYNTDEWRKIALVGGISKATIKGLNKVPLIDLVRRTVPNYRELLRTSL